MELTLELAPPSQRLAGGSDITGSDGVQILRTGVLSHRGMGRACSKPTSQSVDGVDTLHSQTILGRKRKSQSISDRIPGQKRILMSNDQRPPTALQALSSPIYCESIRTVSEPMKALAELCIMVPEFMKSFGGEVKKKDQKYHCNVAFPQAYIKKQIGEQVELKQNAEGRLLLPAKENANLKAQRDSGLTMLTLESQQKLKLENDYSRLQFKYMTLESEFDARLASDKAKLTRENTKLRSEKAKLTRENTKLRSENANLKRELDAGSRTLTSEREQKQKLAKMFTEVQQQNWKLESDVSRVTLEVAKANLPLAHAQFLAQIELKLKFSKDEKSREIQEKGERNLQEVKERSLCQICVESPIDAISFPCLHFQYCSVCLERHRKSNNSCPICRTPISQVHRSDFTYE